nr:basic proline-rich protein-like isoform X1 [Gorilla gorilla gorilla]
MIATGLRDAGARPERRCHSSPQPLEPRQGTSPGREIRPLCPWDVRAEPIGPAPGDSRGGRAVRPGAHHVKLPVPGSKTYPARGLGASLGPPGAARPPPRSPPQPPLGKLARSQRVADPTAAWRPPTAPRPGLPGTGGAPFGRGRSRQGWLPSLSLRPVRPGTRKRGFRGQPPAASVHSRPPSCPPPPFPDAGGRSPGQPSLSTWTYTALRLGRTSGKILFRQQRDRSRIKIPISMTYLQISPMGSKAARNAYGVCLLRQSLALSPTLECPSTTTAHCSLELLASWPVLPLQPLKVLRLQA